MTVKAQSKASDETRKLQSPMLISKCRRLKPFEKKLYRLLHPTYALIIYLNPPSQLK